MKRSDIGPVLKVGNNPENLLKRCMCIGLIYVLTATDLEMLLKTFEMLNLIYMNQSSLRCYTFQGASVLVNSVLDAVVKQCCSSSRQLELFFCISNYQVCLYVFSSFFCDLFVLWKVSLCLWSDKSAALSKTSTQLLWSVWAILFVHAWSKLDRQPNMAVSSHVGFSR